MSIARVASAFRSQLVVPIRTRVATASYATKQSTAPSTVTAKVVPYKHLQDSLLTVYHEEMVLDVVNPATGEILQDIKQDTPADLRAKFLRAREGQRRWAQRPLAERIEIIQKFNQLLQADVDNCATALTTETGKPITQAKNEIKGVSSRVQFFTQHVERFMKQETVRTLNDGKLQENVSYEPLGVVGNISAWNYPYFVGTNVILPALLTGNSVLYKPSEHAVLTGMRITEKLHQAGVPDDAFIMVIGKGAVGEGLSRLPLGGMFFTGSNKTGQRVLASTSERFIPTTLELGGKDPIYVCDDVDITKAAEAIADGSFYNNGQSCCAVERVYIHHKIYSKFCEAFAEAVKNMSQVRDPMDPSCYFGPVARQEHLNYLDHLVEHAKRRGAVIHYGGGRLSHPNKKFKDGFWYNPTVLTNVNHEMEVMHFETFGPVAPLMKVMSDEHAIELMNDTKYGLTAGVYTKDRARAQHILSEVESGTAYWNSCDRVSPWTPWSGRRGSGMGSTLGFEGIRAFLKVRAWHMNGGFF